MSLPHTPGRLLPVTQSQVTVPHCGQSYRDKEPCWALVTPLRLNNIPWGRAGGQPCFLSGEIKAEPGLEDVAWGGTQGCPMLWASLRGHPWSHPTTRKHPIRVFWRGSRSLILMTGSVAPIPWAANRLCPPDSRCFKVLPGTSTHLCSGTNCVLRFWCLTNSGTTAPGAKLCFPQGVHFLLSLYLPSFVSTCSYFTNSLSCLFASSLHLW